MAAALVTGGKVRVNRQRAERPSQSVRLGDVLTIAAHARVRVLRIKAPGVRRGPAAEAAGLYDDLTPQGAGKDSPQSSDRASGPREAAQPGGSRPTKRDRRMLERLIRTAEDE